MKCLVCLLVLGMPCALLTAVTFASEAQQQAQADRMQGAEAGHHPLIDVKFVLREAPAARDEIPRIEFDESRSVVRPMSIWDSHVLSLT